MLVETFSILNIVERGRYSGGISDSSPGCQEPYSAESGSMVIAEMSSFDPVPSFVGFEFLAKLTRYSIHPRAGQVSLILRKFRQPCHVRCGPRPCRNSAASLRRGI